MLQKKFEWFGDINKVYMTPQCMETDELNKKRQELLWVNQTKHKDGRQGINNGCVINWCASQGTKLG